MAKTRPAQPDAKLDLVLERVIDVPRGQVWAAWTRPEYVRHWFAPAPWTVTQCEIDLRPGGIFRTVMRSPDGKEPSVIGCYLEIVPEERLVWTDALLPGFRPSENPFLTATITLKSVKGGTRYTAVASHRNEAIRERHQAMGFHEGWGKALDQLVAHVRGL